MKDVAKREQKINLINCEKIPVEETLQNNSCQIRCSIPVKVEFSDKRPQIVNIHQTESIVRMKQTK